MDVNLTELEKRFLSELEVIESIGALELLEADYLGKK